MWAAGDGRLGTRNRELVYAVCEDVGQLLAQLERTTTAERAHYKTALEHMHTIERLEKENRRLLAIAEAAEQDHFLRHPGGTQQMGDGSWQAWPTCAALVSLEADPQHEKEGDESEIRRSGRGAK